MHISEKDGLLEWEPDRWMPKIDVISVFSEIAVVKPLEAKRQSDAIVPPFGTSFAECDREVLLDDGRRAVKKLADCKFFRGVVLRYVCNLRAHMYKTQERPDSCLKWDQSSWSKL